RRRSRSGVHRTAARQEIARYSCGRDCGVHNRRVSGQLELRHGTHGFCHYLEGFPVEEGAVLELLLASGSWLRGSYSWSGVTARWPGLRFELGGPQMVTTDGARRPMAVMALPPQAQLRRVQVEAFIAVAEKQ